jgi:hypothetical protein
VDRRGDGGVGQRGRGGVDDGADVVARHAGQRLVRADGDLEVGVRQPGAEFADRAEPGDHVRVGRGGVEVRRHGPRSDPLAAAARQEQLAPHLDVTAGRLVRVAVAHPFEHVVVQLAEPDQAVLVAVGLAGRPRRRTPPRSTR